jgi:hypothetical protein
MIKVFKTVSKKGDVEYWATNDLEMNELDRLSKAEKTWGIEMYHRGLKQCCGVEKCQSRKAKAQRTHILLSIRAFLRLESYSWNTGIGWICAKSQLIRNAVASFLDKPTYEKYLNPTA